MPPDAPTALHRCHHRLGRPCCRIDHRAHVQPKAPARAVLDGWFAKLAPGALDVAEGARTWLYTEEGEVAALVSQTARLAGGSIEIVVGVVYGDDFHAELVGVARDPGTADELRRMLAELVARTRLGLDAYRPRPFCYAPPPAWQARQRDGVVWWFPPGFPGHGAAIGVLPARSNGPDEAGLAARIGIPVDEATRASVRFISARGLRGVMTRFGEAGGTRVVEIVVLSDATRSYSLLFVTAPATQRADRRVFEALIDSIYPLPAPALGADAMQHWG